MGGKDEENPFLREKSMNGVADANGDTDCSAMVPAMEKAGTVSGLPSLPGPFTPSIKRTMNLGLDGNLKIPPKLPEGLSISILKSRLEGKKVK